jgi:hypothetical protein
MMENGKNGRIAKQETPCSAAVIEAIATGTRLRGFHSKSSNSKASMMAASGVANMADIPAAAPATRSVFRSLAESSNN